MLNLQAVYQKSHRFRSWAVGIMSLIPTPVLIFVSTSSSLYLKNQGDLDYQMRLLLPFLLLALATISVGFILYSLSGRKIFKYLLYIYYFAGPGFLILSSLRGFSAEIVSPTLVWGTGIVLFLLVPAFVSRRLRLSSVARLLATLAVFLMISETAFFLRGVGAPTSKSVLRQEEGSKDTGNLPNVYHIIIDTFQTEGFELYRTPEVEEMLRGFTYYPQNITAYWKTNLSVPSSFLGKLYDFSEPRLEYKKAAFDSNQSFLYWLKEAGYETYSYAFEKFPSQEEMFDYFLEPSAVERVGTTVDNSKIFKQMWVHGNLPGWIAKKLVPEDIAEGFKTRTLMTASEPLKAHLTFLDLMEQESELPASGRYTFVHMFTTHPPFFLRPDCSYSLRAGEAEETSTDESYKCATKLIVDFVNRLKELGRYDNSLIIIHSDHGHVQRVRDGKLEAMEGGGVIRDMELAQANANALLLIKPPGKGEDDPFYMSGAETTLLDLPPTILDYLGIKTKLKFDGVSLRTPPGNRTRYFYTYFYRENERGPGAAHEFTLKDGKMQYMRTIPIRTTY